MKIQELNILKGELISINNAEYVLNDIRYGDYGDYSLKCSRINKSRETIWDKHDIKQIGIPLLNIDFFKENFLIDEFKNAIFEYSKRMHYKHIDLPFWFEYCTIDNKFYCINEYGHNFELTTKNEVIRLFNSFKINLI